MTYNNQQAGTDAHEPQEVIVALFDVLGFSARVRNTELQQLGRSYRDLLKLKRRAGNVPVIRMGEGEVEEWKSPSAVFSDTILFWADAEPKSAKSFLTTCSELLAKSLNAKWPLRGGIAVGECILDRNARVFIGEPIVEAHRLEEAQNWIGAAVHPSCINHSEVGALFTQGENVVQHTPPLKQGYSTQITYSIEWSSRTIDWEDKLNTLENDAPQSAQKKYQATRTFIEQTRPNAVNP
jgi:hypothetical protein